MSSAFIVGLAGRAGVGKDYTCQKLIQQYPFFKRFALADYAKDILCDTIKISRQELEAAESDPEIRKEALLCFGDRLGLAPCRFFNNKEHHRHALVGITGFIKAVVPDFFMQVLVKWIHDTGQQFVILTDIRFPIEFYWVGNSNAYLGGHTIGANIIITRKGFSPRMDCGYCLSMADEAAASYHHVNTDGDTTLPQLFSFLGGQVKDFCRLEKIKVPGQNE